MTEKLSNKWSKDKKKGSSRYDRIPTQLVNEVEINCLEDYMQFVPYELDGEFTVKEFAKAAHIPAKLAGIVVNILYYIGTIDRTGKTGNSYLYQVRD